MQFGVVTLFPEMIAAVSESGITGRAVRQGIVSLHCWNPRDFAVDRHRTVDDRPYGGGPGMLMQPKPLIEAISAAKKGIGGGPVLCLSPQGRVFDQSLAKELAGEEQLVLMAGRYEGIDERVMELEVDEEISIGDYVLSGGELAAMVVIDAITRLLPGALGGEMSAQQDSFMDGLLDCPHYTRPEEFAGSAVPEVLLSGDHERIRRWRLKQSLGRTWLRRPDLLEKQVLNDEQHQLLEEFKQDFASRTGR